LFNYANIHDEDLMIDFKFDPEKERRQAFNLLGQLYDEPSTVTK